MKETAIFRVRMKSELSAGELKRCMIGRRPRFLEVPGPIQKMCGRDPETGSICGVYCLEDEAAIASYRESELAKSIPDAHEAVDVPREACEVPCPPYPARAPVAE